MPSLKRKIFLPQTKDRGYNESTYKKLCVDFGFILGRGIGYTKDGENQNRSLRRMLLEQSVDNFTDRKGMECGIRLK